MSLPCTVYFCITYYAIISRVCAGWARIRPNSCCSPEPEVFDYDNITTRNLLFWKSQSVNLLVSGSMRNLEWAVSKLVTCTGIDPVFQCLAESVFFTSVLDYGDVIYRHVAAFVLKPLWIPVTDFILSLCFPNSLKWFAAHFKTQKTFGQFKSLPTFCWCSRQMPLIEISPHWV